MIINPLRDFLKSGAASGILLLAAGALALILANSPLSFAYDLLLQTPVEIRIGPLLIAKPLLLWINDGLMAVFFFLIGLELKRSVVEGELSDLRTVTLPAIAAVGGMAVPAAIYAWFTWGDEVALQGWAIPAATDIAFAVGILALLGSRARSGLRIFLMTVAIFDDVGAIIIIAVFYTADLSGIALLVALALLPVLYLLNRKGVTSFTPYLMIGLVIWIALLKSGVHATLAGVLVALFIPLRDPQDPKRSPLRELEHDLHSAVAYGVLPLFAFANSGMSLAGIEPEDLLHPVTVGVAAGLFLGKQAGIMLFGWLGVALGLGKLPRGMNWLRLYGVALLCGVGFTMSLFIGGLAFGDVDVGLVADERLGIFIGSMLSGVAGYLVLRWAGGRRSE